MKPLRNLTVLLGLAAGCANTAPAGADIGAIEGGGASAAGADAPDGPQDGTQVDGALTLVSDSTCENPCTFRAGGSLQPSRVVYRADSWVIGESSDAGSRFAVTYAFQDTGERHVVAQAYDASGSLLSAAGAWIEVLPADGDVPSDDEEQSGGALPDVPYFYQYANRLYPSSTCQNTTIAMVLAMRGWTGDPDVITEYWGKDRAQSPAGFSDVLNGEAAYWGIDVRSTHRTDATFADLHALLDRGIPVPVHGYFTSYGHVLLVLGYDAGGYWVNDPAGEWSRQFMGGYPYGWDSTVGDGIYYPKAAFEAAIGTSNGTTSLPLWIHELSY
jgi:hypothetical protein